MSKSLFVIFIIALCIFSFSAQREESVNTFKIESVGVKM